MYRTFDELGQCCEVRRAGRSLRLYTDGTFHSQYNPSRLVENTLWDLLWLPALLQCRAPQRVLVLGVGGGAVIRKLMSVFPGALLVGVDISPTHITIARQYFGVKGSRVLLLEADAIAFVQYYRGPPFDLIVEDLFTSNNGNPERVMPFDNTWLSALSDLLSKRGQIITNFDSYEAYTASVSVSKGFRHFASYANFRHQQFDSVIGSYSRERWPQGHSAALSRIGRLLGNKGVSGLPASIEFTLGLTELL